MQMQIELGLFLFLYEKPQILWIFSNKNWISYLFKYSVFFFISCTILCFFLIFLFPLCSMLRHILANCVAQNHHPTSWMEKLHKISNFMRIFPVRGEKKTLARLNRSMTVILTSISMKSLLFFGRRSTSTHFFYIHRQKRSKNKFRTMSQQVIN